MYESDQGRWQIRAEHLFCAQCSTWQKARDRDQISLRGQDVVFVHRDENTSGEGMIEKGNARGRLVYDLTRR